MKHVVHAEAKRFVCRMRGGSQPILIEADDNEFYVVKFFVNLQGPLVVINEVLGSTVYRDAGLSVPEGRVIKITDRFLNANKEAWFHFRDQSFRPTAGYAFGSRLVGGGDRRIVLELLPGGMYPKVRNRSQFWPALAIDILLGQTDLRQAVFLRSHDQSLEAKFIDFGSDYRLPPNWNGDQRICACRYPDMRIYPMLSKAITAEVRSALSKINVGSLETAFSALPIEWKLGGALDRYAEIVEAVGCHSMRADAASLAFASHTGDACEDTPAQEMRDRWNRQFAFRHQVA